MGGCPLVDCATIQVRSTRILGGAGLTRILQGAQNIFTTHPSCADQDSDGLYSCVDACLQALQHLAQEAGSVLSVGHPEYPPMHIGAYAEDGGEYPSPMSGRGYPMHGQHEGGGGWGHQNGITSSHQDYTGSTPVSIELFLD